MKNLRSQVSRAGIYTLGDMFTCLEKNMDLVSFLTVVLEGKSLSVNQWVESVTSPFEVHKKKIEKSTSK